MMLMLMMVLKMLLVLLVLVLLVLVLLLLMLGGWSRHCPGRNRAISVARLLLGEIGKGGKPGLGADADVQIAGTLLLPQPLTPGPPISWRRDADRRDCSIIGGRDESGPRLDRRGNR